MIAQQPAVTSVLNIGLIYLLCNEIPDSVNMNDYPLAINYCVGRVLL